MPLPLAIWAAGGLAALAGSWAGWRWLRTGRMPDLGDVIPFGRVDADEAIDRFADEHGIDPDLLRAVIEVESGGRHEIDGRPVIRLEVHRLQREAGRSGTKRRRLDRVFRRTGSKPWTGHQVDLGQGWIDLHPSGNLPEHQRRQWLGLALARQILGDEPAYRSASVGVGQIMGSNHADAGETSAKALFDAAKRGKGPQVQHFLNFIERNKDGKALAALKAGNIPGFVAVYNGSGQVPYYTEAIGKARARLEGGA